MKLRLRDNSIRFRITKSELAHLVKEGFVEAHTDLGPSLADRLTYRILAAGDRPRARMDHHTITLEVPKAILKPWAESEAISLALDHQWTTGKTCVLVEKDLPCTNPREGEDEDDKFAPPAHYPAHCR
jgi:hypothetical protein